MATLNFPSPAAANDTYTFNGRTWTYTNNVWTLSASTIDTSLVSEGTNLYFTNARATAAITSTALSNITVNGEAVFKITNTEYARVASNGIITLGGAPGSASLRVTPVASAVNYVDIWGGATGTGGRIWAKGTDSNIALEYISKGTAPQSFYTGASPALQFRITDTANAVNYLITSGAVTNGYPYIRFQGSDTNVGGYYDTTGTGSHVFRTNVYSTAAVQFAIQPVVSAVNYIAVGGAAGSGSPYLTAAGTDTNITMSYYAKNTGAHNFATGGGAQFQVSHTASAVNYARITGAVTTGAPILSAQGSDTNVNLALITKGTGQLLLQSSSTTDAFGIEIAGNTTADRAVYIDFHSSSGTDYDYRLLRSGGANAFVTYVNNGTGGHSFQTNGSTEQLRVSHTASAVNYLEITGNSTGYGPTVRASGSDTNIYLGLSAKGTSPIYYTADNHYFNNQAGNTQFRIISGTGTVNYIYAQGGVTGSYPYFLTAGSDTNIPVAFGTKGTGFINFFTDSNGSATQFLIARTASPVNYLQVTGAALGNSPTLSAQGSNTNINLNLTPKGTGVVKMNGNAAVTGNLSYSNTTGVVKVYQYYNSATSSFDTVFI